ncbi:MAG: alkaline phosphatase D family protein [Erythrobacter sp.]|uniref:alkaline phosphatase D family protein n=1 Tax=Erythrobacter sp. TaxID=1042 RepID=UPI0026118248|nr:alkaline phosphatase D family protein [Erythrobacter sp.]MDJ0976971.1 alkaline phosphatase D family protein [Erythrobacter sp.]
MARFTQLFLASAALALTATPSAADQSAPDTVTLSPDELLAPYYARLRQSTVLPNAGEGPSLSPAQTLTRVAFGSCNHQSASQHMWDEVLSADPQLFLMLGDNVYGDSAWDGDAALESLRVSYEEQAAHPEWQRLRKGVPMLATWDDHDYGLNDKGASFPMRRWAEAMFEEFWGSSDAVRARDGIYDSVTVGPQGQRVQIILLDTRFFRSDLKRMPWSNERPPLGVYVPDTDPAATVLGPEQWRWLEAELAKPADLRIVASSIQIITEAHNFESWENFPLERTRLFDALASREESGLVLLSGDRHSGGVYKTEHQGEEFWEITSSSLNRAYWRSAEENSQREPDPSRVSLFYNVENYGMVDFDWAEREVTVTLKDRASETLTAHAYAW